ncbi:MAG: MFS transporter, partial [bacterium]|nr:MFS transporter [bacterium]
MPGQEPHRESVVLFSGSWFLYNFSYWVVMSYVPVHLAGLGMTQAAVGDCIATPALLTLLTVLPFGYLSDRLPARRLSQIGLALLALWALALPILPAGWPMFVAFGLAGLGMPLHLVSFNALFLKHLQAGGTGRKIGGFTMAQFCGFAMGPMAVPAVQHIGAMFGAAPSVTFYVAAAGFAGAFAMTLLLRDPAQLPFHLGEYMGDIKSKRGALATAIILLYSLHFGSEQAIYPTFLREQCGMSQWGVGVVFAYSGILIAVVAFVAGRVFDRHKKMLTAMMLAMVFSGG